MSVTSFNHLHYDTMQSSRWLPVYWRNTLTSITGQQMETVCLSKMLVVNNQKTQCHKKEYHNMKIYCFEILKVPLCLYDMIDTLLNSNTFTAYKFIKSYISRSKLYKLGYTKFRSKTISSFKWYADNISDMLFKQLNKQRVMHIFKIIMEENLNTENPMEKCA